MSYVDNYALNDDQWKSMFREIVFWFFTILARYRLSYVKGSSQVSCGLIGWNFGPSSLLFGEDWPPCNMTNSVSILYFFTWLLSCTQRTLQCERILSLKRTWNEDGIDWIAQLPQTAEKPYPLEFTTALLLQRNFHTQFNCWKSIILTLTIGQDIGIQLIMVATTIQGCYIPSNNKKVILTLKISNDWPRNFNQTLISTIRITVKVGTFETNN